jgi:hypothetical protein
VQVADFLDERAKAATETTGTLVTDELHREAGSSEESSVEFLRGCLGDQGALLPATYTSRKASREESSVGFLGAPEGS